MKNTGERIVPELLESKEHNIQYIEHIERYKFASKYLKNKVVLDIACGVGYGTHFLCQKNPTKIYGVDIDLESINYAKKKYFNKKIIFEQMDAAKLKFKDNFFDVIVSFETLEHISSYNKFLEELHRILKKGGLLIISTPDREAFEYNDIKQNNHFHVIEFSKKEFINLFENNYKNIKVYGQFESRKVNILNKYVFKILRLIVKLDFFNLRKLMSLKIRNNLISKLSSFDINNLKIVKIKNNRLYQNNIILAKKI